MLRTTIVYESIFGATREVAEAMVRGPAGSGTAVQGRMRRIGEVTAEELVGADLLDVGAPRHVHSLSRPKTRREAEQWSFVPERGLMLEPGALDPGIRELLYDLPDTRSAFIAFDTRAASPELFFGSAAKSIWKDITNRGTHLAPAEPVLHSRRRTAAHRGRGAASCDSRRFSVDQPRRGASPVATL
jgi:hypothetical protein